MLKGINLKSELLKYIVVLMSGTVAAQLISYLLAPLITRIYLPEESAELGLFIRIISVGAAIATARYELALPIIKLDHHSFRLYRFAVRILIISLLVSIIVIVFPLIYAQDLSSVLFFILLPVGLGLLAMINLGTNWSIRMKKFRIISMAKISNSAVSNLAKVGFGLMNMGYVGLILGAILGLFSSGLFYLFDFFRSKKHYAVSSRSSRNYVLAREYIEFPKINLPHTMMDLGRDLIVALLLLELFSKEDFGLYDHSYRMLRLPLVMVGTAMGQVFFQKCSEKVNNHEDVVPLLKKTIKTLALLSLLPFTVIFFFGEELFAWVFGENWRGAGTFSEMMTPWFLVSLVSSPISMLPLILRKQKEFFFLSMIGAALMIGAISICPLVFDLSMKSTLLVMSLSQGVFLMFLIIKIFQFAGEANKPEMKQLD